MLFDENDGINSPEESENASARPAEDTAPVRPPEIPTPEARDSAVTEVPTPETRDPAVTEVPTPETRDPAVTETPAGAEPVSQSQWQPSQWQPPQPQWEAPDYSRQTAPAQDQVRQPYTQEHEVWRDPAVESASGGEGAYSPGHYAYGAQNYQQPAAAPEKPKKEKKKRKHGFLKAVCLVVVCALVSGLASWAVVEYMLGHSDKLSAGKQVVLGSTLADSGSGQVQTPPADTGKNTNSKALTGKQIYELGLKQVVGINTSLTTNFFGQITKSAVSGSGFIISEDGYILTNYHVISYAVVYGGELTVLMEDGSKHPAEVVGYIESNDVAVIKIDADGLTPVTFGDSDAMEVGETVYAIGNPLGELEYTMTDGIVSALDRVITTTDDITGTVTSINMFQISAAVNHGNSGGPVYNTRGEVIGIVTAKYSDAEEGIESLGFAIPINDAVNIATQLIENGYVTGAGLGITGRDDTFIYNEMAMETYNIPYGVFVETVKEGSAAEKAGIVSGDIITGLGGSEVSTMDELKMLLRRYSAGDTETITIYRMNASHTAGESLDLSITFEDQPVEEQAPAAQQQPSTDQNQSGDSNPNSWPWGLWGNWGW